jgi:hypothetical protein
VELSKVMRAFADAVPRDRVVDSFRSEVEAFEVREDGNTTSSTPPGQVPTGIADLFSRGVSHDEPEPHG